MFNEIYMMIHMYACVSTPPCIYNCLYLIGRVLCLQRAVVLWDIRHKLKSWEILFPKNILLVYHIVLKICTEHGCDTAMLCAKFENDITTEMTVLNGRDFARFKFVMRFWRISNIATGTWWCKNPPVISSFHWRFMLVIKDSYRISGPVRY